MPEGQHFSLVGDMGEHYVQYLLGSIGIDADKIDRVFDLFLWQNMHRVEVKTSKVNKRQSRGYEISKAYLFKFLKPQIQKDAFDYAICVGYDVNYNFKDVVRLKERGYIFYPIGINLKIGKLFFYHGHHFGSINHTRNHLVKLGSSIMYGHHHDLQQSSLTHMDGVKSAWSIGCLKDMGDEKNAWLGNRKHNWSHAFSIVDFFENGYFTVHVIQIINGRTSLWGSVIDGNV